MRSWLAALLCCAGVGTCVQASQAAPAIKVNQLGFWPQSSKLAVIPGGAGPAFEVVDAASGKVAFTGKAGAPGVWQPSGENVALVDFSALSAPGRYRIKVAGAALSDAFVVQPSAYRALNAASIRAFYFNRSGIALPAALAGAWARPAGHPDTRVLVHASAASPARPEGTIIASPKGWYDAGDYNKYIVNSGISTYQLLAAYEHYPALLTAQSVGLPESGNGIPDILNEALWNLEWMLSMQDPADGGVYNKLTNKRFDGMVMPDRAMSEPRYVVAKGTAATLDFAATMATGSRILKAYDKQLPGMSARMLAAAEAAWAWAQAHPAVVFKNPADVSTGEYGDGKLDDEWAWAAAELYISTRKDSYYQAMQPESVSNSVPSWSDVRGLAWISLAHHRNSLTPAADRRLIARRVEEFGATLAAQWQASPYKLAMRPGDFVWGSNAVVLNQAVMLIQAYRINGKPDHLQAAQSALDYVLGRNATGYSFVTGFGARPSMFPHHRPSVADQVVAPVPGFLTGGPQAGQQDKKDCKAAYPAALPALSYLDDACSYASNEVAINWNAPLVYVTAALEAHHGGGKIAMESSENKLAALARQEQVLQFETFNSEVALELGLKLVEAARGKAKPMSVNITRDGQVLFAHAMTGASKDQADWIRRKNNLVNRVGHSSFYVHTEVVGRGGNIDAIPDMDVRDYAAHGGSFPLIIKGTGPVGTITVSGLPGVDDHQLVIDVLKAFLKVDGV